MNNGNIVRAFETSEYRARLDKVRALMVEAELDALLVLSGTSQCYLTGYEAFSDEEPQALLVTLDEDPHFILRKMDANTAVDAGCWLPRDRIVAYPESYVGAAGADSAWDVIGEFVKGKIGTNARIGAEVSALGFHDYHRFVRALGIDELRDGSELVSTCRLVKSERELSYMKDAAGVADGALLAGIDTIAVGVRHRDVAAAIMSALCSGTETIPGGPPPGPPYILGGEHANAPHHFWVDDVFTAGQQAYLGVHAYRHRYAGGVARTVHLGPPTSQRKHRHEGALAGFHAAVDTIRPGARFSDVAGALQAAIRPYDLTHEARIGYSVGLDWTDGPSLSTNNDSEIVANMAIRVLIAFNEPGENYCFGEAFHVTEGGAESLNNVPRILFERPV